MRKITTIQNSGLTGFQDLMHKRTLRTLAIGQEQFLWNTLIDVKSKVETGFFDVLR